MSQVEPVRVHIGDDDEPGTGMARDGDGHHSNRSCAGDQHILAEHRKRQRGVDSIAEGIEDRSHVTIDRGVVMPDIGHRQHQVFGERSRPINPDALGVSTQMAATGQAVPAAAAHHMPFAADNVAGKEVSDVGAHFHDLADELVTHHHRHGDRLAGPGVPLVNVHVRAADARAIDLDQNIVDAHLRNRHIDQPQPGFRLALR